MKKKVIKLTEKDLQKIVKRVIKEGSINELGGMDDGHPRFGDVNFSDLSQDEIMDMGQNADYTEEFESSMSDEEFNAERHKRLSRRR
jgi:hypothetical protein